jgi:RsiW-degrading membrane proteinase PrsW (M82 family)
LLASPADRRLAVAGACSIGLSLFVCLARLAGVISGGLATAVVLLAGAVAVRVAFRFTKHAATSAARARVSRIISDVGLGIATVTIVASLPVVLRNGGPGTYADSLFAHLWSLALLTALAWPVRTLTWRAYVGAGFTGYLALTQLARLAGRPVVNAFGLGLVQAIWVPVTEELIKAIPVLVFVIVAARRLQQRPSALDCALLGAWVGAGYAVYENSQYGRVGGSWSSPLVSLLFPSDAAEHVAGTTWFSAGHLLWSALIGLGLGIGVLYRHRYRHAWLAIPLTLTVAIAEHIESDLLPNNQLGPETIGEKILQALTLNGLLSLLLLMAGIVMVLRMERRAIQPKVDLAEWIRLPASAAIHRGTRLAVLQLPPATPASRPAAAPAAARSGADRRQDSAGPHLERPDVVPAAADRDPHSPHRGTARYPAGQHALGVDPSARLGRYPVQRPAGREPATVPTPVRRPAGDAPATVPAPVRRPAGHAPATVPAPASRSAADRTDLPGA